MNPQDVENKFEALEHQWGRQLRINKYMIDSIRLQIITSVCIIIAIWAILIKIFLL